MAAESSSDFDLEIAHVLFMDIVGYSKGLIDQQRDLLKELNKIVRETHQFKNAEAAGKLIRLPTGDGMALAFFTNPEAPLKCAIEVSEAVGRALPPAGTKLQLRMGIHSGPVSGVTDVNDRSNVAGAGINMAQRVMDCGDAGHILLSKRASDDLGQYEKWQPYLHDLGVVEVKHGMRAEVVNFYNKEVGNPELPAKIKRQVASDRRSVAIRYRKFALIGVSFVMIAAAIIGLLGYRAQRHSAANNVASEKSIAVLPFTNLSDEKENAFFADGIQDDILTSLGKIADLKVVSRTSVMQYRGMEGARNLREIARGLGVENILEGSVRRAGNRVLVNVQLIDARNDRHIWAERYDRTVTDSIGLQGELATQIASALRARLDPEEKTSLETKPTDNPNAYALYLQGLSRERIKNGAMLDLIAAEQLYIQAIAFDPNFALAHARLSIIKSHLLVADSDQTRKEKARSEAEQALRLSPTLGEAHMALGLSFYWGENNYTEALKEFSIAAKTLPNEPEILHYIAGIYRRQGRWRESLASYQRAQDLDPRNGSIILMTAVDYMLTRDWPAAAAAFNRALEIAPDSANVRIALAYLEVFRNGNLAAAKELLRKIPAGIDPDGVVSEARWDLSMLHRDFAGAEESLANVPGDFFPRPENSWPKAFYQGRLALARGDTELAQHFFLGAAPDMEGWVRDHTDVAEAHAMLGSLYAYMGRKDDAIRESRRAVELEPEAENAFHGTLQSANLALVYARTGEADQAIALIERLLSTPGPIEWPNWPHSMTLADLRLRWEWDPLRTDPRFQKILAGPEPKTVY